MRAIPVTRPSQVVTCQTLRHGQGAQLGNANGPRRQSDAGDRRLGGHWRGDRTAGYLTQMLEPFSTTALSASPRSSDFVFPTPAAGDDVPILATTVTRAMSRVTAELSIKGASPHDLRRTVGTELARLRIDSHVRKLILNHAPRSRDVTETVYNRYAYDTEKRDALTRWEQRLAAIIDARTQDSPHAAATQTAVRLTHEA